MNDRLRQMLASATERMNSSLRENLIPHPGELGSAREEVIRQFLRGYLPKRYEISSGFLFDATGDVSQQLDIIIADSTVAPRFETAGGIRFYPCECVVSVGQVKSQVTSRKELWGAIENVRSASNLDRTAGGRAVCTVTGMPLDHTSNHLHRIFTFIFITDRAPTAQTTREVLAEAVECGAPHEWPNLIFSLKSHLVTFHCDDGVCPNTMHARAIASLERDHEKDGLLRFYIYLAQALTTTSVANMSSWAHMKGIADFSCELTAAPIEDSESAPPYLASLRQRDWSSPYQG